jgi:hypothetical protein
MIGREFATGGAMLWLEATGQAEISNKETHGQTRL